MEGGTRRAGYTAGDHEGGGAMARVSLTLTVDGEVWREGDVYVSHCPVLDVYSQGDSEQEAGANLFEALQLFIQSCYERGTLDAVLKECGFTVDQDADAAPEPPTIDLSRPITVPVALLA